jgi:hypothetical protein
VSGEAQTFGHVAAHLAQTDDSKFQSYFPFAPKVTRV